MPTKKKSQRKQPQQRSSVECKTKSKAKCHTAKAPNEKGAITDNTSLIHTLKENNKSLASALDEARKKCTLLQLECIKYQQERQELVEKMAIFKAMLTEQIISEIKVDLLKFLEDLQREVINRFEWKLDLFLNTARFHAPLTGHTPSPSVLSPIPKPDTQVHFVPFINVTAASHNDDKRTYPKTPHPSAASFKHPQYSSTPNPAEVGSSNLSYPCCAIDFEECVLTPAATTAAKECDQEIVPTDVLEGGSKTSPNLPTCIDMERKVRDLQANEKTINHLSTAYQERKARDLQTNEKTIDLSGACDPTDHEIMRDHESGSPKNSTFEELKDHLAKIQISKRPRRKCTTLSTSYQEPQIKSKLRQGDPFTDTSMMCPPIKTRPKKGRTVNKKSKPLQDITNKKC